jgi:hypothetical protein
MDKYADPPNVDNIIDKIKNLPTLGDIKPLVDEYFPDWIVGIIDSYSEDYPMLEKNWRHVCKQLNVTPVKIIIVDCNIILDDTHKLVSLFSEILTKSGFCVRSKNHLFPCKKCGKALPQPEFYDLLKPNHSNIPTKWSIICENC